MTQQGNAYLYTATGRALTQTNIYRCFETVFNTENTTGIFSIKDETVAENQQIYKPGLQTYSTVIIPVVGAISLKTSDAVTVIVPGEILFITAQDYVTVINPYSDALVNYLFITLPDLSPQALQKVFSPDLSLRNRLHNFTFNNNITAHIGLFNGRKEIAFKPKAFTIVCLFVVSGAFEIQGRLLEERDTLVISGVPEIEIEALSENAILIAFDIS